MFDDAAPVWHFLNVLHAIEGPEHSRTQDSGRFIIEVFPALALPALNPAFFGRSMGPRYNPTRRTFNSRDWIGVAETARSRSEEFGLPVVAQWCSEMKALQQPRKSDQDKLDAVICMLIALWWRRKPREQSAMIGDVTTGYMITPISAGVRTRLATKAAQLGVPLC